MSLCFPSRKLLERDHALTFDDVLIVPARSEVKSRTWPDLKTRLTKKLTLNIPLVSANMDTVTEAAMAIAMDELGGMGIIHRFLPIDAQVQQVKRAKEQAKGPVAASIGVSGDFLERAKQLVNGGAGLLTIDIAHGHSTAMLETISFLKNTFPDVEVIAGNVATPEGAQDLVDAGADAIKVGIGPGSMCTTRVITGCGVPQLTAIALCAEVADRHGIPIIADGGIRSSGDMMKAFAAGASTVMLGSLFAGTIETPGEIKKGHKIYRGMASKAAQVTWRGEVPEGMAPEGESTMVPCKGHVRDVVLEMCGGIRSGMSYINAMTLSEIRERAYFIEMTPTGLKESHAHGITSAP